MARYVLVEFEDDADAEKLRRMIDEQTRKGKRYRVAGIFARPKKVCECPRVTTEYKGTLVVRGRRFGWNTCVACKRAKPGSHRANNLLAIGELMRMPGEPIARYEYRADTVGIFEVPVKNIKEVDETKELTNGG